MSVEAAGQTQDLALNPASGTFDGTLFLPAGTQKVTPNDLRRTYALWLVNAGAPL